MTSSRFGRAVALFGTVLAACAPTTPPTGTGGAAANRSTVAVREHVSGRYLALIGPKAQHDPPYLDTPETNFFCLRSFVDQQTGASAHQLYVAASYDAKRDWDAAHDGAGQTLKFIPISRYKIACDGKDNCSYAEEFAAILPESELRQDPGGLAVTFTDRAGDAQTIAVSADQIAAQLAALAEHEKPTRDASAAR
jgi:hypothetical protein